MDKLESGEDKIQKICESIRNETLLPAREQAKEIVENAHIQSDLIIKKAHKEKERMISQAKKEIEKERKIFDSALNLATRQALEVLKQKIENELFSKNLKDVIVSETKDPKVIANLINVLVKTIEKFGIDADVSVYIPKEVDVKEINKLLLKEAVSKLKEKEVLLGDFEGGIKLKIHDKEITIDISNDAIKNLVADYLRADFRSLIFNI
ncbi:MAG: V-type proton ATPase subunit E [Candidatus Anoxychlamydiales bacterium]|nr:V-type proton ATPase subunit E [Candidatus Anoxychlamydiales bacterium]NGX40538.1 V-type proton ATPase subunit E [Candidatus Anoxychlamydiales bacterium]HEU63783.1 V-type ATP synthase subunit E [Chlamydiota bacterium]